MALVEQELGVSLMPVVGWGIGQRCSPPSCSTTLSRPGTSRLEGPFSLFLTSLEKCRAILDTFLFSPYNKRDYYYYYYYYYYYVGKFRMF